MDLKVRSTSCTILQFDSDGNQSIRVFTVAVINNPYAGDRVENLEMLVSVGPTLGELLVARALEHVPEVHAYGKGAIIGLDGEIEHGAAVLHPGFGKPIRDAIGGGRSVIPSTVKFGTPGASLSVPLHHKDDAFSVDYFDSVEVGTPHAPTSDELVIILGIAFGPRPGARVPPPGAGE